MTILLVDDDPTDALLVRETLKRQDSDLTISDAQTCEQALDLATRETFDAIVMDEGLKGMPGSECVKLLRAQKYRGAFGLITGHPDTRQAVEAMINGADFYLSKDDVRDGLLVALSKAVDRRQDAVRTQEAADAQEKQYEELRRRRDEWTASGPSLETQRDIKNITNNLATLNAKVATIEGSTVQQFDMLVKMQESWQKMLLQMQQTATGLRVTRWKQVGAWVLAAIASIEAILLAYFAYLQAIAK